MTANDGDLCGFSELLEGRHISLEIRVVCACDQRWLCRGVRNGLRPPLLIDLPSLHAQIVGSDGGKNLVRAGHLFFAVNVPIFGATASA